MKVYHKTTALVVEVLKINDAKTFRGRVVNPNDVFNFGTIASLFDIESFEMRINLKTYNSILNKLDLDLKLLSE